MNRILFVLTLIVVLLPSCAPSLGESLSPTPYPPTSTSIPFVVTPTPPPDPLTPTATPIPTEVPLPQEILSQIPADKQYEITNGQILVDGKVWFELDNAGEWRKSDWKLLADAPHQNYWEEKYQIQGAWRQDIWLVLTGENLEVTKDISDQPVVIKGRLAVIPNPYQQGEILKVIIPYRYEWGNGLFNEEEILENYVDTGVDYILQLPAGKQLRIEASINSLNKPAECTFGTRCGWTFNIAD